MSHGTPGPSGLALASPLEKLTLFALLSLVAGGAASLLYVGQTVFVPIAFAVLFALILSSPVEALHRRGVPRGLGAMFMLFLILATVGLTLRLVWGPARAWLAAIPHTIQILDLRLGPLAEAVEERFAAENPARVDGAVAAHLIKQFEVSVSGRLLIATPAAAAEVITVVILTLFLVTGGAPMTARLASTLVSHGKSTKALQVIQAVRSEVARYYVTIGLINLGLGVATAIVTMLLGLPNPLLWGTMAAVLNFVPYIGSTITLLVLSIEATVIFTNIGHVVAVAASFLFLLTVEGQVVEPLLVGRRLKLSPTVVLLAFWFAGWFWGVAGIVLVMPLLVTLKVVAEHLPNGRIVVELLSPSPRKPPKLIRHRPRRSPDDATQGPTETRPAASENGSVIDSAIR